MIDIFFYFFFICLKIKEFENYICVEFNTLNGLKLKVLKRMLKK